MVAACQYAAHGYNSVCACFVPELAHALCSLATCGIQGTKRQEAAREDVASACCSLHRRLDTGPQDLFGALGRPARLTAVLVQAYVGHLSCCYLHTLAVPSVL